MWINAARRNFLADVVKDIAHGQFGVCGYYYGAQLVNGLNIPTAVVMVFASFVTWVALIVLATWLKTGDN